MIKLLYLTGVTTQTGRDKKEVIFLTTGVEADYRALPAEVKEVADGRITALQNGDRLPSHHAKPLIGDSTLVGISEIVLPSDGNTYRVYYVGIYEDALIVLDAGMKKSKTGRDIPKAQKETLAKRKKDADQFYQENQTELKKRAAERAANRTKTLIVLPPRSNP